MSKKKISISHKFRVDLFILQWNPLNVIAFGQTEIDNINQMMTITNNQ
jgi:hypothetical protein